MWLIIFCRVKCLRSSIKSCELIGNRADVKFDQYLIKPFSFKNRIEGVSSDATVFQRFHCDFKVPLITPSGVPGVLYEPVVQARG